MAEGEEALDDDGDGACEGGGGGGEVNLWRKGVWPKVNRAGPQGDGLRSTANKLAVAPTISESSRGTAGMNPAARHILAASGEFNLALWTLGGAVAKFPP